MNSWRVQMGSPGGLTQRCKLVAKLDKANNKQRGHGWNEQ